MNQTTHRTRRARRSAGFTMIEVMVAVLLTAIATSGIIGLYMVETRASGFSRHTTEATVLAQDQMELLRTSKVTGTNQVTTGLTEHGTTGGIFTRTWTCEPDGALPYDNMRVDVTWTEDGASRVVTLRSRRNQ
jgi:prepilin-type N-terminal cleavage/methylation domain-containing protein